ncbi:MAG: hypothetical protein ACSLE2_15485 [Lysobacterales bacterium]
MASAPFGFDVLSAVRMQIPHQMDAPRLNAALNAGAYADSQGAPAAQRVARARRRAGPRLAKITKGSWHLQEKGAEKGAGYIYRR